MELTYSLRNSNMLCGGNGASFEIYQLDTNWKSRGRSSCSSFSGNTRIKACYRKKLKYMPVFNARFMYSNLIKGDVGRELWGRSYFSSTLSNDFYTSLGTTQLCCQGSDSTSYIDGDDQGNNRVKSDTEESQGMDNNTSTELNSSGTEVRGEEKVVPSLDELREVLQKALNELEVTRLNSTMFEEKAQRISETAIALKDEAANAWNNVNSTLQTVIEIASEEAVTKEAAHKATMALSLAEARLQVAMDSLEAAKKINVSPDSSGQRDSKYDSDEEGLASLTKREETLLVAQNDVKECQNTLANCESELKRVQCRKEELQKEVDTLNDIAEKAELIASKAEEDVASIMLLAEQAVAFELEAAKRVSDAKIPLQKAEKIISSQIDIPEISTQPSGSSSQGYVSSEETIIEEEGVNQQKSGDNTIGKDVDLVVEIDSLLGDVTPPSQFGGPGKGLEDSSLSYESDQDNKKPSSESLKEIESDLEKSKITAQTKKPDIQKDFTRDGSPLNSPKALLKKSSRFFSASFFSSDDTEFSPTSFFQGLVESGWKQLPKLIVGSLLIGAGVAFYMKRADSINQLFQQPDVITSSIDEVSTTSERFVYQVQKLPNRIKKLMKMIPHQEMNEEEASLVDMLWLLLASVIFVPVFQKIPGGSPVLGYLVAGILIGPYGLSIIRNVHATKAIAEFGVVFLLFNIGLELSVERLSSMKKYVFGLGTAQVLVTAAVVGLVAHLVSGLPGPAAIVIGNGLALSSTAVVLQVLQERGESTSRHGRSTFSVLLFQDLAVVVLLILIPLISPNSSKGGIGFQAIAEALGLAAVKAIVAITAIIAGGRLLLRPIYKQIAENKNAEIFSANTLLVILGTSLLTARAGLSMALGAFLAGLLLAETEFSLQVESDIAPYRGLLLGLFFMTVGMSIDPKLLVSNFPVIMGTLGLLIGGKTLLVAFIGRLFGISLISAIRVGLLLAPGGEFAFVAFGEAVNQGIMSPQLSSLLFLVVGISMALTPWLAAGGQLIANRFDLHDVRSLLPVESETDDLQDHIIICGFGRVGQIIAQLLSERLIPFVALDVRSDRVAIGRALDLPVYFGDAGSKEVLHKVGAERACAAAITLDSPGANYRTVWALSKHFPNVKTFVRAHDVDHGLNLEKAGATAVVPETLEPSLQLASAVLAQAKLPMSEIAAAIDEFRSRHLSELTELCQASGSCLGYGFSSVKSKSKTQPSDSSDDNQGIEGTLAI
ncbi:K(+) efflux antiporter 2, chloroplastic-like [Impatiens glandulifera]|uniref:K(+) efflux antiporter 2, chloroplastic-like n=1 Tax=Impatiens glandulifera TaxID=253017 RepID=UPI001FB0EB24|nr:K(+) efflux antiporter 2, chloroplastic-like [Impatiens glandulifera]